MKLKTIQRFMSLILIMGSLMALLTKVLIELLQGLKVLYHPVKHEKRYLLMQRGIFMLMNAKNQRRA